MALFLAVDAGGTKTDLLLADEERTIARARTGTIKRLRADNDTASANLLDGLRSLEQQSGLRMVDVVRTCIGTAGESVPLVADWLRESFRAQVGGRLLLLGDVEIALDATFRGGPGVLVLAGTGSNVAGRTPSGKLTNCGGWGPALGDEGSGYAIGERALRAIATAVDEERATTLQQAVLDFWQLPSMDLLVEYATGTPRPDPSALTHLVVRCAARNDVVAQEILRTEGEALAYTVRLLIRRLHRLEGNTTFTPTLAFAGSIMEHVPLCREALLNAVRVEFPGAGALDGVVDPVEGALWRARHLDAFEARLSVDPPS